MSDGAVESAPAALEKRKELPTAMLVMAVVAKTAVVAVLADNALNWSDDTATAAVIAAFAVGEAKMVVLPGAEPNTMYVPAPTSPITVSVDPVIAVLRPQRVAQFGAAEMENVPTLALIAHEYAIVVARPARVEPVAAPHVVTALAAVVSAKARGVPVGKAEVTVNTLGDASVAVTVTGAAPMPST